MPESGSREPADYLLLLLLALVEIVFAVALALWVAGQISGVLSGHGWPHSSPADIVSIAGGWVGSPGDPARAWPPAAAASVGPAWLVYLIFVVLCVLVAYLTFEAVRFFLNFRRRQPRRRFRLGFASGDELRKTLGAGPLLGRASYIRPSYAGRRHIDPEEIGFYLGRDIRSRQKLYAGANDAIMVIAPARQGKEDHLLDPYTISAPGPCIQTAAGSDVAPSFLITYASRAKKGKVWVFDPVGLTNWPARLRWSPVRGAERPRVANERARALASGAGLKTYGEGANFVNAAIMVLRAYLHAAALSGRTLVDVMRWSTSPTDPEPVRLLREAEAAGAAAVGWAAGLESTARSNPEHSGAVWAGVLQALNSFSDPRVLDACSPGPGDEFNLREFLAGQNTLYVMGHDTTSPVTTALLEDLLDQTYRMARRMPGTKLELPLTVELNSATTVAPIPNLATYMGEGVYHSVAVHVYCPSLAAVRNCWGQSAWELATVRMYLGGSGNAEELEELSKMFGELPNKSRGGDNMLSSRVLSPEELRLLPRDRAVVLGRNVRPAEVQMRSIVERKDWPEIKEGRAQTERMMYAYLEAAERNDQSVRYARMNAPGWSNAIE